MLAVCGLVVTTEGESQIRNKQVILISNHVSSLDPFVLSLVANFAFVSIPLTNLV